MRKYMTIEQEDGSVWAVPVEIIARNRATYYAEREYGGNVEESLKDDTIPLFESDEFEIQDWASSNMDWSDLAGHQVKIKDGEIDFQEAWVNGDKGFIDELPK